MSGSMSRRRVLITALSGLAVIPLGASALIARNAHARSPTLPPAGSKILSRVIERSLRDGNLLRVTRSWAVQFEQSGQGFAVHGKKESVSVDAPARLAPIARIEKDRSTAGMFPILLNDAGMILAAGNTHSANDMREALAAAQAMLIKEAASDSEAQSIETTLRELAAASGRMIETLPADLFFPREPLVEARQPLSLRDGTTGEFHMRYETLADPQTGMMMRAERAITTALSGEKRYSREVWTLV